MTIAGYPTQVTLKFVFARITLHMSSVDNLPSASLIRSFEDFENHDLCIDSQPSLTGSERFSRTKLWRN